MSFPEYQPPNRFTRDTYTYKTKWKGSQFLYQVPMFALMHFYVSHQVLLSRNFPLRHHSMSYFSQNIRNVSNNFHYVSDYLWVKWNRIFPVLVFWLSQTFKFFTCGILIIITMMTFYNSETSHLCFLWRKTRYKRFLFCYARRHSCVWVLNVFSKTSFKSWHIQNTVGCLFTWQKLSQVSRIFDILRKYMHLQRSTYA